MSKYRPTQLETLVKHFYKYSTITPLKARALYRIEALPRRISDLEERGYMIEHNMKTDPTGRRYAEYRMIPSSLNNRWNLRSRKAA